MRKCGPTHARNRCARRPGSRASIDRPVAGSRWQSARTPNTRWHADREDAMVRAGGAGAHLWDHLDHLQRPCRPWSRQPEVLGCHPKVPARYRHLLPLTPEAVVAVVSSVGGMETVVGLSAMPPARQHLTQVGAHERQRSCALLNSAPHSALSALSRRRGRHVPSKNVTSCVSRRFTTMVLLQL